jgi:multisubunit Na+/H+ antiporter MnhF subunit
MRGAGGTSGGVGEFLLGLGMAIGGGYMLLQKVTVTSGGWYFYGVNAFGLTFVPFLLGAGMLFYNGKSIIGGLLMFASIIMILAGVLVNLRIYFQTTSLFDTLIILTLLAGGLGLLARSLRPHGGS